MSTAHPFGRWAASALLLAACIKGTAQDATLIDHDFSDWSDVETTAVVDTTGPLVSVGFKSDEERVYFLLEYDRTIALDEGIIPHGTKIALDLDGNAATGQIVGGFQGAEMVIHLADRYVNSSQSGGTTEQSSLNSSLVRMAPTYGAAIHEVAIDRGVNGFGGNNTPIRWSVRCNSGQQVSQDDPITLSDIAPVYSPISLDRAEGTQMRVAFWNMNRRVDEAAAQAAMARILQAVQPDVIGMSEVEDFSADMVRDLLDTWMPLASGSWHVAKDDWDLMVASRWPIVDTHPEVYRQYPVIIDTGTEGNWMVTASHLKCCNGADQRQTEADEYMAFLRDAMATGGEVNLPNRTPVIYGGDLNMVGPGQAMHTLLTGDIDNEAEHGADFAPDWDGTALRELKGLQTDQPMNYTWLNSNSQWPAGKLDYILIQDGVLEVLGNFTLETASMGDARLTQYGLNAGDDMQASDHLIIVADLRKHDRPGTKPAKQLKRID